MMMPYVKMLDFLQQANHDLVNETENIISHNEAERKWPIPGSWDLKHSFLVQGLISTTQVK